MFLLKFLRREFFSLILRQNIIPEWEEYCLDVLGASDPAVWINSEALENVQRVHLVSA